MSEVYVREYKCPACGAELKYDGSSDSMTCAACGNSFSVENLHSYQAALNGLENSEIEDWVYTQTAVRSYAKAQPRRLSVRIAETRRSSKKKYPVSMRRMESSRLKRPRRKRWKH